MRLDRHLAPASSPSHCPMETCSRRAGVDASPRMRLGHTLHSAAARRGRHRSAPLGAVGLAVGLGLLVAVSGGHPATNAQDALLAYAPLAQWPGRSEAAGGLLQSPGDLDVARDGRVYIADAGVGGVHTLLPSGTFLTPFGATGGFPSQLGRVGAIAIGPDPQSASQDAERLYVLDPGVGRVVIYGLDGQYLGHWEDINGQDIAASSDGRVYVLDRETSQVRTFDADTGSQRFVIGERGTENGQFTAFAAVAVSPDGRVLAVSDKRGSRIQLFDLATDEALSGASRPSPARLRRVYDLLDAKYNRADVSCRAERLSALGADLVFAGEGETACLIDSRTVIFAIASSANHGTICRATVRLPVLRADTEQYYALATYDPNPGKCGEKQQTLATTPVVVQYSDQELRNVVTVWQAASNATAANPILISPQTLSMPRPVVIFVQDMSPKLRFFSVDGDPLATAARDSGRGAFRGPPASGGDFDFFEVLQATGTDILGEVFGSYMHGQRSGTTFKMESGVGRFRTIVRQTQNGPMEVIDPIWTDPLPAVSGSTGQPGRGAPRIRRRQLEIAAVAYHPLRNEFLVLRSVAVAQQRTVDMQIVRYGLDGSKAGDAWDVPDDGQVNPYTDMAVGSDGRVLLLDGLGDVVRVYAADGSPLVDVPVACDARAVASGPPSADGALFVLREPGLVERLTDDGRVTARFDARPLAYSDPTTLTDLVVDEDGRVYIADAQTSLITVFGPTGDADALPVPADGTCTFVAGSDVEPRQFPLGEPTTVRLTLDGRCGVGEEPADILVVVPYYAELQAGVDPSASTITEMLQLVSRVDFGKHRVGIVSYYNTTKVELALTNDRHAYDAAARNVQRFNPPNDEIKPRLNDALKLARAQLPAAEGRHRVMVLLNPDYCDPEFEPFPGACAGYPSATETAAEIRQAGIQIVVVGGFGAFGLASSDEDMVRDVLTAHRRMVHYQIPRSLADWVDVRGTVPTNMVVHPGSLSAGGSWSPPELSWQLGSLASGAAFVVGLTPTQAGHLRVFDAATAFLTDTWGVAQTIGFPIPEVEVLAPTPTAAPATATATAVLPTATHPRSRWQAYLPLALAEVCTPRKQGADVVLVIDTSSSMAEPGGDGGSKLAAAQTAAQTLLSFLEPTRDQAALVTFDRSAALRSPLGPEVDQVSQAVRSLVLGQQSRVDAGLALARAELEGPRHRAENRPVILLFSDGLANPVPVDAAVAEAEAARANGVAVYVLGWGADVDRRALQELAGRAEGVLIAPTTEDLRSLHAKLTPLVGCPGEAFWGRR